jgi:hypothetical protein
MKHEGSRRCPPSGTRDRREASGVVGVSRVVRDNRVIADIPL